MCTLNYRGIIHAPVPTAATVGCYDDAGCTNQLGSLVPGGDDCCTLHGNSAFHDDGGGCTSCSTCKYEQLRSILCPLWLQSE